jgi:hypothetical protein
MINEKGMMPTVMVINCTTKNSVIVNLSMLSGYNREPTIKLIPPITKNIHDNHNRVFPMVNFLKKDLVRKKHEQQSIRCRLKYIWKLIIASGL